MSNKWKDKLLSSSLPLEFEVAKILAKQKFSVSFDYTYQRLDDSLQKDFSIDISSLAYYPFNADHIETNGHFLVECKYRNENINWLFLPDINSDDFAEFSTRGTLKYLDEFTESHSEYKPNIEMDLCLKGVEINNSTGDVHDKGIVHGINQLLYGLPISLKNAITDGLSSNLNEVYPHFICPILVTNANLYVAHKSLDINKVKSADKIEEIGYNVPYLSFYNTLPESFNTHCKNLFSDLHKTYSNRYSHYKKLRSNVLSSLSDKNDTRSIEEKISEIPSQPNLLMSSLANGFGTDFFKEIIICNVDSFDNLIQLCKSEIEKTSKTQKKI